MSLVCGVEAYCACPYLAEASGAFACALRTLLLLFVLHLVLDCTHVLPRRARCMRCSVAVPLATP